MKDGMNLYNFGEIEFDNKKIRFVDFNYTEGFHVIVIKFNGRSSYVKITCI